MRWVALAIIGLAACGSRPIKSEGEECFASSECDTGLVCDIAADPAVCKMMGSGPQPQVDGAPGPLADAAPGTPDAAVSAPDAALFDAAPP